MSTKQKVDTLWRELRKAVNDAYAVADKERDEDGICLRDYAEDISWSDNLAALLGRECAAERQHRSNRPSVSGFSVETASKLILMGQVQHGAELKEMPRATGFLVFRKTAIEAQVVGYLIREQLTPEWLETVKGLDYAKLMTPEPETEECSDVQDNKTCLERDKQNPCKHCKVRAHRKN